MVPESASTRTGVFGAISVAPGSGVMVSSGPGAPCASWSSPPGAQAARRESRAAPAIARRLIHGFTGPPTSVPRGVYPEADGPGPVHRAPVAKDTVTKNPGVRRGSETTRPATGAVTLTIYPK